MTLPIPSNVFADGELTNEASWYLRIFSAINTIYATQQAQVYAVGTLSGTTDTSGILVVTHGLSFTPSFVIAKGSGQLSTSAVPYGAVVNITSSTFQTRWGAASSSTPYAVATAIGGSWIAFK